MRDLLREMSTRQAGQAGQAGTEDIQGLFWRLADVAGHLDGMVMMEEDVASRAREEGGCKDFRRNNDGKRTLRDEDKRKRCVEDGRGWRGTN